MKKMIEINEKFEKLKMRSSTKSFRNDLSKGKMIFSEESSRATYGDYSVSFLPEARTALQKAKPVWKYAPHERSRFQ